MSKLNLMGKGSKYNLIGSGIVNNKSLQNTQDFNQTGEIVKPQNKINMQKMDLNTLMANMQKAKQNNEQI